MEQLIALIVMLIIGSLFSSKGQKKGQEKRPPVERRAPMQPSRQEPSTPKQFDPMRKLKDMSKEMFEEIEREFTNPPPEPPSRQTQPIVEEKKPVKKKFEPAVQLAQPREKKQSALTQLKQDQERVEHRGRLSVHGGTKQTELVLEKEQLIPSTQQELIKGIIFSEILGPPKSKQ